MAAIRVPADQPTIQAAVATAATGDTVLVSDGTYLAHGITITKSINIHSVNGRDSTVIDGESLGGIFQINASDSERVVISGFTIRHGDVRKGWATIRRVSGQIEVRDCLFEENYCNGGVIDARGGTDYSVIDQTKAYVADCVFRNNSAENFSGVLGVTIVRSLFYNNSGWNNPAVLGSSIATNCTAYNNSGGVLLNPWTTGGAAASKLVNCILWGNSGYSGQQIDRTSSSDIKYSLVQGGYSGIGNLNGDPLFEDASSANFRLRPGSPAIDSGDPTIADADGSRSDMGAHGGGSSVQEPSPFALREGLIAYYPFNGNANDVSGNGRHATVQGNYKYLSDGTLHLIGDGALFYSGGGHVVLPNYGNLNSGFTISIWVGGETDHGQSIYAEYYVWMDNNAPGDVHISQHDFGVGDARGSVNFPLKIADYTPWKQLVLVYSPTHSAAYLNGLKTGSTNNITVNPFPVVNAAIGRHWWAGGANSSARMTMDVKNFRVYNRALSDSEVSALYNWESAAPASAPSIIVPPAGQTVVEGQDANFSVVATGTPPLSYRWLKDNSEIPGATQPELSLASVKISDQGSYTVQVSNIGGIITSTPALLTVIVPPRITTQPADRSIIQGQSVTFSASSSGTAPLVYQWLKGGSIIERATQADLRIDSVSLSDAGTYQLRVSNAAGTATSSQATLTVVVPPTIASGPTGHNVIVGQTARLAVVANGSPPLSYQWFKDGLSIAGANGAELTFANAQTANAGRYQVRVSNAAGTVNSGLVTLTVIVPPSITIPPASQTVIAGQSARFVVAAGGSAPLTYEWFQDGARVPGASLSELVLANVQPVSAGSYTVHITNEGGSITSSPAVLTVLVPPTIITAPISQTVIAGQTAKLTVVAAGSTPLSYQWIKDGITISGATQSDLIMPNAQQSRGGNYRVRISNAAGSITSIAVALTVAYPPSFISQPEEATVFQGQPAKFSVTLAGTQPIALQWLKNGSPIAGATSASFDIASTLFTDAGNYSVDATSPYGAVRSLSAKLTVKVRPNETLYDSTPGGGIVLKNPFQSTFPPDSFVTLTAQPADGWQFLDWKGSTQGTNPTARVQMTYSRSVRARFGTSLLPTPTGNGSIHAIPPSALYPYGSRVQVVAIPADGHFFAGWSGSVESLENPLMLVVKDAHPVLVAAFDQLPAGSASFIVQADGFGRILEAPRSSLFRLGQSVTNTAIPGEGQDFIGWSGDLTSTENPLVITLDKSKSIVARFTKRPTLSLESLEVEGVLLSLSGEYTNAYPVLRSSDLQSWESAMTLTNSYGESQLIVAPSTASHGFYTVATLPPPKRAATANCTVVNGFIVAITVLDPGVGYTSAPSVHFVGAGTGATAVATIVDGTVDQIRVISAGSGYTGPTEVVITAP